MLQLKKSSILNFYLITTIKKNIIQTFKVYNFMTNILRKNKNKVCEI